ncbi:hypothetical protein ACU5JM_09535 [Rhodococcus erythropolis]|uniref:hypothetical protein n=1 Tax=Rhodococcus erythropolis TaxID=1833 RepID=UPI00406BC72B
MTVITANEYRTAAKVCDAEEDWSRAKALRELADLIDANDVRDAEREARHLASKLAHDAEITALAIIQMEGESGWWRSVECDKFADRTYESMTGDNQQAIRSGVSAVLAHLTSTGRLIPAGGMALTAEQVENVRTAREGLRGYRNFDGNARGRVNRLIAAVDALFPATEPAEEETKAEATDDGDVIADAHEALGRAGLNHVQRSDAINQLHNAGLLIRRRASSPVVPAPTETGPWQTWEAVPDGVTVKSANGERFRKTGVGAVHLYSDGAGDCCKISVANDLQPAPFVAAEEG